MRAMSDTDRDNHGADERLDPEALFANHKSTGEPVGGHEVRMIVDAGLASQDEFHMTGGHVWTHRETFPDPESEDGLPVAQTGGSSLDSEERLSDQDLAIPTATTESEIAIEIRDGQPVCPECGGSVQCSGIVSVSMVNVDADCYEDDGEVELTYDWADAGSAEFEPTEFHCVACGAALHAPGDLRRDVGAEEDETGGPTDGQLGPPCRAADQYLTNSCEQ
jgi:hypothetical protein